MPCSCGNTSCPCGIPCYCLEESCKCHDCAIALPRFCKVCNKKLITERRTDEESCSCFIGESIALILDNHGNPQCRLGNIPIPIGYFVSGKLVVNVMIPIPAAGFPHFMPQQPFCSMPPLPLLANHSKISLISDAGVKMPLYHPLKIFPFPTAEPHNFLSKSDEATSDYDLSSHGSNSEQNSEIFCNKLRPPPGFLQSTDNSQTGNVVQNTKSETEANSNFQETASFYLPSVIIGNISYPVGMMAPIWRLPSPDGCITGSPGSTLNLLSPGSTLNLLSPGSTLNLLNPFYMAGPVSTTATYENEFSKSAPCLNFEENDMRCFPENQDWNMNPVSSISLQTNEKTLDPTVLLEQPNLVTNDESLKVSISSNNATGDECAVLPSPESVNAIGSSEHCGISANYSVPDQSTSLSFLSTSTIGKNYYFYAPDTCNSANNISGNGQPESTSEVWQDVTLCPPLPEIPPLAGSIPNIPTATSRLQQLFNPSSRENEYFPRGRPNASSSNDERNKENTLFYIDSSTTQKMEKNLKPILNGNVS